MSQEDNSITYQPDDSMTAPLQTRNNDADASVVARRSDRGKTGAKALPADPPLGHTGLERVARRVLARDGVLVTNTNRLSSILQNPRLLSRSAPSVVPPGTTNVNITETVVGSVDGRERIFDTDQYPYSAIALLIVGFPNGLVITGTGWFVSARTLVTAGHCVYDHDNDGGWASSITVIPGCNGPGVTTELIEPFGQFDAVERYSVAAWVNDASRDADYGAVVLNDPVGDEVGTFGLQVCTDQELQSLSLNIAGYPSDKGEDKPAERDTLWFDVDKVVKVTERRVFYNVDTMTGESGGPAFIVDGNDRVAVAIHAYGFKAGDSVQSNSGTRITNEVFDRIQSWKK